MEKKEIELSVIIPVYRVAEKLLYRCLNSVCEIRDVFREVLIIVDGDSLSALAEKMIAEYQRAVPYPVKLYRIRHSGVASARNYGLQKAEGRWIFFLDADDYLKNPEMSRCLQKAQEECADIAILDYTEEADGQCRIHRYKEKGNRNVSSRELLSDVLNPQSGAGFVWCKLFRNEWIKQNQICFNSSMTVVEDAEFMLRAALADPRAVYLADVCYAYWRNPSSAVHSYRSDYADQYIYGMCQLEKLLRKAGRYQEMEKEYAGCVLYHLLLIAVNDTFHPDNPSPGKKKRQSFRKLVQMPLFRNALKEANIRPFSVTRKIAVICIRTRCYRLIQIIAQIRHRQFDRTKEKNV